MVHSLVVVKKSSIHGRGAFARRPISHGEWIIQYKGEKITKKEAAKRGEHEEKTGRTYIFELNKRYDIDGASGGNEARFFNHTKQCPHCEALMSTIKRFELRLNVISLKAKSFFIIMVFPYGVTKEKC